MIKLSYSSISNFLQCPRKFKEVNVDYRFKDSSFAANKGTDIHKNIEEYITGVSDEFPLGDYAHPVIENLRGLYKTELPAGHKVGVEECFAVNIKGEPVDYKDKTAVLRGKIDLYVLTPQILKVIDWKSGKRRDNRMQSTAYDILTRHLLPNGKREYVFDYLKDGRDPALEVSQADRDNFWKIINTIQEATVFPEKPSPLCAWCPVPKAFCKFKKE